MTVKKAVVLFSGGLDSMVVLDWATRDHECYCLTFDYGQRHRNEIDSAKAIVDWFSRNPKSIIKDHRIVKLDFSFQSVLTSHADVPKDRTVDEMTAGVSPTYVPARNTVFLSIAMAWCEILGSRDIFFGANANDQAGYPDCRPAFLWHFEMMSKFATAFGEIKIHSPLLTYSKNTIINEACRLGLPIDLAWSCYDPQDNGPCLHCDACILRTEGLKKAGR